MSGIVGTSHSKSKALGRSLDTAKAWGVWNQDSPGTLVESFNVSSITNTTTGVVVINFAFTMPDTNFVIAGNPWHHDGQIGSGMFSITAKSTTSVALFRMDSQDNYYDRPYEDGVVIYRK